MSRRAVPDGINVRLRRSQWAGWIGLCLTAAVFGETTQAQQAVDGAVSAGLRHTHLYGIVSSKSLDNVNPNDARAALKVWLEMVGRQKGFVLDSRVDVTDSVAEIRERLVNHSVDVIALSVVEYLELEGSHLVVPALTHGRTEQGEPLYSYVLLVNSAVGETSLASLRGRNAMAVSRGRSNTAVVWLDVLLGKEKLGRAANFFGSIEAPGTPQGCILPVFFGSADACVVDEVNLRMAQEMNPQLGRLRIIARSRPMIESLIVTPVEPHPYHKELFGAMRTLHEDPRGRQLLMVFKTDRLVPVRRGDLDSARELWHDYDRLSGGLPGRSAGVASPDARGQEVH